MNDPASAGMLDRIAKRKKGISLANKRVPGSGSPSSIADLDSASGNEADYSNEQFEAMQADILNLFSMYDGDDVLEAIEDAGIDPQWWKNDRDECIRELKGWLRNAGTDESAVTELTKGTKWKYTDAARKSVNDLGQKAADADTRDDSAKFISKALKRQKTVNKVEKDLVGEDSTEAKGKKSATLKIQKFLNKNYDANLDLDGVMGPLTIKSINKFMPAAKAGLADTPSKTTAVQGKKTKG